jgi:hypothetical protein
VVEAGGPNPDRRASFWQALRADPMHAPEIGVLHAIPQLTPHVEWWWSKRSHAKPLEPPDRLSTRVLRRSTHVARRGGLITGSSFYVGMLPAMAMIYCEQLVVVLRIAAVYGRDPCDPIRAAEILVVQGRYATVEEAAAVLQLVGASAGSRTRASDVGTALDVARQLPSMIGLRVRAFARSPLDLLIAGAEVASYLVPVVSLPVWAFANARATRRLGRAAIDFYTQPTPERPFTTAIVLPSRPSARSRRIFIASVLPLALALGVLFSLLPFAQLHQGLRWIGLVLGELALVLTFARLIRLTRVPSRRRQGAADTS